MPPKGKRVAVADAEPVAKATRAETTPVAAAVAVVKARPKVDDHVPGGSVGAQVYQEGGINWAAMLNQTDLKSNANKFYVIQLVEKGGQYITYTRWGRVGEKGQDAPFNCGANLDDAKKTFCDKFKDKTKNDWNKIKNDTSAFVPAAGKYTWVDIALDEGPAAAAAGPVGAAPAPKVGPAPTSALHASVQAMLKQIFDKDMFKNKLLEQKIDANKMPLGKLSKAQLQKGYAALEAIGAAIKAGAKTAELADLTSAFFSIIPHDFGRAKPPVIDTEQELKLKFDLLDVLGDIQAAMEMDAAAAATESADLHPLDAQYKELNCALQYVDPTSPEYAIIDTYTKATQGYRKCTIIDAFTVDRPTDKSRMNGFKSLTERKLLWHGTSVAVVAAILKTGLRIMPHAGGRVGKGLYFASENGKSAGYVGVDHNIGYMFLCEVALGKSCEIKADDSSLNHSKVSAMGVQSIVARGRTEPDPTKDVTIAGEWGQITVPQGAPQPQPQWADSRFAQSEYLVYDEGQVRVKYVLKMKFGS